MSRRPRVVVLAGTRAYQVGELRAAAARLDVDAVVASDRCHVLAEHFEGGDLAVDFADVDGAVAAVLERVDAIDGVIATDERTAPLAAALAAAAGLPHNEVESARLGGDKLAARRVLAGAGLDQPRFAELDLEVPAAPMGFPVVVKPRCLSGSRGVMRADTPDELAAATGRLAALLADPEIQGVYGELAASGVVEEFIAGRELAYEGVLRDGALERIAIFDKPDPLDGPTFAETIYVSPTDLAADEVAELESAVAAAAAALGLRHGPIHAEVRRGAGRTVVIEVAARSIGGLCGRVLRIAGGLSVEELVLAATLDVAGNRPSVAPAGVLMLPVEEAGVLVEVRGLDRARAIEGIAEIEITARPGDVLVPLPEGDAYLGFVFSVFDPRAPRSRVVEALREARATIAVEVRRRL